MGQALGTANEPSLLDSMSRAWKNGHCPSAPERAPTSTLDDIGCATSVGGHRRAPEFVPVRHQSGTGGRRVFGFLAVFFLWNSLGLHCRARSVSMLESEGN